MKKNTMVDLSGISIPITTPFQNDQISYTHLETNIEIWKKYKLTSFVLLGSTGEGALLSDLEKGEFIENAVSFIDGEKPVIVSTAFQSTSQTIDLLRFAVQIGVKAGLVLPPYYYRALMNHEALKKFYFDIADSVDIPIIIYHFPKVYWNQG
jgi:dihydrodipicolinate synthase/N-acetylneuraminate lyase